MKKLFTFLLVCAVSLTAFATDFKDQLTVTVFGSTKTQEAVIQLDKQDNGKYTLRLNNFKYSTMAIGNIVIADIDGTTAADGILNLTADKKIKITEGDDSSVTWLGPKLGEVGIKLSGKQSGDKLYANLQIAGPMGMKIGVVFGDEKNITNGINEVKATHSLEPKAIFTLDGKRVEEMKEGEVYIVKYNDNTTKKEIK